MNISHQLFDYKITFVHIHTTRKHKFKRRLCTQQPFYVRFTISGIQKNNLTPIWFDEFNLQAFKVKKPLNTQNKFLTLNNY